MNDDEAALYQRLRLSIPIEKDSFQAVSNSSAATPMSGIDHCTFKLFKLFVHIHPYYGSDLIPLTSVFSIFRLFLSRGGCQRCCKDCHDASPCFSILLRQMRHGRLEGHCMAHPERRCRFCTGSSTCASNYKERS